MGEWTDDLVDAFEYLAWRAETEDVEKRLRFSLRLPPSDSAQTNVEQTFLEVIQEAAKHDAEYHHYAKHAADWSVFKALNGSEGPFEDDAVATVISGLFANGADPNFRGIGGRPHVCMAIDKQMNKTVFAFLDAGLDPTTKFLDDHENETDLACLAAKKGLVRIVVELVKRGAVFSSQQNASIFFLLVFSVLSDTFSKNHIESVDSIADFCKMFPECIDAAVDKNGMTALCYAVVARDVELVRALLEAGADPNAGTSPPLFYLALSPYDDLKSKEAHYRCLMLLLRAGADPNVAIYENSNVDFCAPILFAAVKRRMWFFVEELLNAGADLFAKNAAGKTVTEAFADIEEIEIIRQKIEKMMSAEHLPKE